MPNNDLNIDWKPEDEIYLSGTVRNLDDNFGAGECYQVRKTGVNPRPPLKQMRVDLIDEFSEHYGLSVATKMAKVWIMITAGFSFRDAGKIIGQNCWNAHHYYRQALEVKQQNATVE